MRISTGRVKTPAMVLFGCALLVIAAYLFVYSRKDRSSSVSQSQISNPSPAIPAESGRVGQVGNLPYNKERVGQVGNLPYGKDRYDQPGQAAEFRRLRRLPEGETEMPIERYLIAQEQMRELPIYSTVHKRLFPSRQELMNSAMDPALLNGWKSLGPGNVGGRTRALLVHPTIPDVMYAAAAAGGVWKTTDGGRSWRPLADLLPNLAVNSLAMDPANPEVIYAGTGEGFFNHDAIRGAGIFRSFDGGATWRRLEGTITADFHYVNDIVISPTRSNRIYAATRSGVMRSLDGGSTWTRVLEPDRLNGGCFDLAIRADSPGDHVFAACGTAAAAASPASVQATIYRNANAEQGLSGWEVVFTEPGMGRTSIAIAPSNQNVVYAVSSENGATGASHSLHAVFRSTGGGAPNTWTTQVRGNDPKKLNTVLFTNPIYAFNQECHDRTSQFFHQGWYNNVIAVDPKNENTVWVGGVDLFRSDDGGANWGMASFWHLQQPNSSSSPNPRYMHADQHAIAFHPQFNGTTNQTMFVGNDGGVYRTDNARARTSSGERAVCSPNSSDVTWTSLNNGYAVTQFYHGVPFAGGARYIGGAQDNGVTVGSDETGVNGWKEVLSGDGGYVAVDWNNPNVVYAATTGLSLRKSTDGGLKFNPATTGVSNIGFNFIAPFLMDPSDPNRLWLGGKQMWRTRNAAANWSQASADLTSSATAIAVAQTDANFVLAGTMSGHIHHTTIGLNSNADTVWPSTQPRSGYVSSVAFDPTNRDVAYATYSTFGGQHVWRSQDRGASWQAIDGAGAGRLPDIPVNCIVVDPANPQRLYIGTDLGVFVSPDGGATWAVENTGFANAPVEWLALNIAGQAIQLFAFTHGRGVWRVPLGGVCSASLSPARQVFTVEGGDGSVDVTASGADCEWAVEEKPDWITIIGGFTGRGSGTVTYSVTANPQSMPRAGTITIAGERVRIVEAGPTVNVSAASLRPETLAPESIVTAFGAALAGTIQAADSVQLPTVLAGAVVTVKDSAGVERPAPLFFVSPNQVNYQIPPGTADGPATVMISNGDDKVFSGSIQIARVAPGLFSASASGQGLAVGQALRVRASGEQVFEPLANWDAAQNRLVANPIDLSNPAEQVYLILYGTGWRHRSSLDAVNVKIGGVDALVQFAGAQGSFAGLDQINLQLPRALAGRGEMDLVLTVDGRQANVVRISVR